MATEIAKQLIYNLRNDDHVREHFSISSWAGKKTCGTVGCIAGTALVMAGLWEASRVNFDDEPTLHTSNFKHGDLVSSGQGVLGIEFEKTADHLFMPFNVFGYEVTAYNLTQDRHPFLYLPKNAQPQFDTIQDMLDFYKSLDKEGECITQKITPDHAAHALEQVTVDEIPYVNWKRAFEEA